MINIYLKVFKQLHDEICSFIDKFEDENFFFYNLVYDEKIK